jgi:thiamine-phosphate diphosphorylase
MLRVSPEQAMKQALEAGVRFFQYRDKAGTRKSIFETSLLLSRISRNAQARFIVNDHADISVAVDADGVHLGQDDLPIEYARKLIGKDKFIGISTHSLEQARTAEREGADYLGFGPLFTTATKDAGQAQGIHTLSIIKQAVTVPVIAIGGITHDTVREVMLNGADGVAVISAILAAPDIRQAAEQMVRIIADSRRGAS